jgi:hypothetical protein
MCKLLLLQRQTGSAKDPVHAPLDSSSDPAEASFQPLVNELHVQSGLLGGKIA